ncbi:hypothetical protein EVAR_11972_1 [Eumeta japonica]|uniref:Uncharacterized protein n=1 Tax=Eumeta variegata TaxID=151549 RepID=A0A4C1U4Q7_EUMVA|nr:hypothetical protein EVAR_11972_1 [Eumeta japonica]
MSKSVYNYLNVTNLIPSVERWLREQQASACATAPPGGAWGGRLRRLLTSVNTGIHDRTAHPSYAPSGEETHEPVPRPERSLPNETL